MPESYTPAPEPRVAPTVIPQILAQRLKDHPDDVYCEVRSDAGRFEPVTVAQLAEDVRDLARGLIARGIGAGDRVGLLGNTRYEWVLADLAILSVGAVTVPIYQTSTTNQISWIAQDAQLSLLIVENSEHAQRSRRVVDEHSLDLFVIDRGGLDDLAAQGRSVDQKEVDERIAALTGDDLCSIVYTSGTTGKPKGAMLSHANFMEHAINGSDSPELGLKVMSGQHSRTLMFLPLSHVFGRYITFVCLYSRSVIGYTPSMKTIVDDLQDFNPTWLLAVPRVFETVFNKARSTAGSGPKGLLFDWASRVAYRYSVGLDSPHGPSAAIKAQHQVADALVFKRLRASLGGAVEYSICGGAPLGEWLGHFYRGIGIEILEGYGATETAAPTTVNLPGRLKVGSVGPAFPGCRVRTSATGEIQVKGPNVFRGYLNNDEATQESFDDGWYKTGDLGRIDEDGCVFITGREKEILVTAGGENVQPATLENSLRRHTLISQAVVVGDREPFVAALITLDEEMLAGWFATHRLEPVSYAEAVNHPKVREAIATAVQYANEDVNRAQSIRKFVVLPRDLEEGRDELSASLKVRRPVVLEHFKDEYNALYGKD